MTLATLPKAEQLTERAREYTRLDRKKTVVLFAGAGGSCMGIEEAYCDGGLDQGVDLAINHDPDAISCHMANHPLTDHLQCDVFEVDPESVEGPIGLLHASPDCTDFSKAKGGVPTRNIKRRSLAWVVVHWAFAKQPDVITLENVEEFEQWGPLRHVNGTGGSWRIDVKTGRPLMEPVPEQRGETFAIWINCLRYLGYQVEWRQLRACDYGTPTTRNRLFVIARRDGKPIVWPEPTHGPEGSGLKPYVPAAACIDFNEPMCSIFATRRQAKGWSKRVNRRRSKEDRIGIPQRPLKPKTQKRLARGLDKFVLRAAKPFIVDIQNFGWDSTQTRDIGVPMPTVSASPRGGGHAIADVEVAPFTVPNLGERNGQAPRCGSVDRPSPTVTTKGNGANLATIEVAPFASVLNHDGDEHRCNDLREPARTVTSRNDARAVVAAHLLATADTQNRFGLGMAYLQHSMVAATFIQTYYSNGSGKTGQSIDRPGPTVTSRDRMCVVLASGGGWPLTESQVRRARQLASWARKMLGKKVDDHLVWVQPESGRKFALLAIMHNGSPCLLTDLAMRMLTPRELARCQGFRADYVIDRGHDGRKLPKYVQVRLIGNSVCRQVARALVRANVVDMDVMWRAAA